MYPSAVHTCAYGRCLVATSSLQQGSIVQRFEGPRTTWDSMACEDICYVLILDNGEMLVPTSDARYMNHSCEPNCKINDDLTVETVREVHAGEELTFCYNITRDGEDPGSWDPRWTFTCRCGSPRCQGVVDKYVREDGTPWHPKPRVDVKEPALVAEA